LNQHRSFPTSPMDRKERMQGKAMRQAEEDDGGVSRFNTGTVRRQQTAADKGNVETTQTDHQLASVPPASTRGRRNNMKSGTQDQAEGKFHKAKGKLKEIAGKLFVTPELEAEGKDENRAGKVQEKTGQVKKVFGK